MHPWLTKVRHDLVKRAAWPARDLCEILESGAPPLPPDLRSLRNGLFALQGEGGEPRDARALWSALRKDAPPELDEKSLEAFGQAIDTAMDAVARAVPDELATAPSKRVFDAAIQSVLALETLFDELARDPRAELARDRREQG